MLLIFFFFFFNDTATTEIYTLSLHDALPIYQACGARLHRQIVDLGRGRLGVGLWHGAQFSGLTVSNPGKLRRFHFCPCPSIWATKSMGFCAPHSAASRGRMPRSRSCTRSPSSSLKTASGS